MKFSQKQMFTVTDIINNLKVRDQIYFYKFILNLNYGTEKLHEIDAQKFEEIMERVNNFAQSCELRDRKTIAARLDREFTNSTSALGMHNA